jgi:hypothetical protein
MDRLFFAAGFGLCAAGLWFGWPATAAAGVYVACVTYYRMEARERRSVNLRRRANSNSNRIPSDIFLYVCQAIDDWKRFRVTVFKSGGTARFPGTPLRLVETMEKPPRESYLAGRYGNGLYCLLLTETMEHPEQAVILAAYLQIGENHG